MSNRPWEWTSRWRGSPRGQGAPGPRSGHGGFEDFLESLLGIRQGEGRRTSLCFAYLFLSSAIFILGRTARDTLFLSRYPIKALPWMFVLFGVVSALVALFYGMAADRAGRILQIRAALAVGAVSYAGVWLLIRSGASWIYPAFYVWTEVIANLLIMQFWTLANDLHDPRAAKRLFGTIGSARILGVIVCGLTAGLVVRLIGTVNLLWVLAGVSAALFLLTVPLAREYREAVAPVPARRSRRKQTTPIAKNPYVRALALVILLIFVALTVGDYQFKIIAKASFEGREDDLARFFSLFYAGAGLLGFLFQILATPRILRRYGVLAAMLVMPLVFGSSSLALLLAGGLLAACLMKLSDNAFQYTIHETALQVLYVPFSTAVKAKTRALLDTAVKPLAYGLGGLVLVVAAQRFEVPVRNLALITLPLVLLWVALLPVVRKRYLRALEASLSGRAAAFSVDHEFMLDSGSRALLIRALESADPSLVLHTLERLREDRSDEVLAALRRLARHEDPKVREEAFRHLGAAGDPLAVEHAREALADPHPQVMAAALGALCVIQKDEAVEVVSGALEHPEKKVRAAAVAGLIRHGGVEGAVLGGAHLDALLKDPNPKARVLAAGVIEAIGPAGYRPLKRLLADGDLPVRKAALKAAASVADPRLVPVLLDALAEEETRRHAGRALKAVGEPAVQGLLRLLADPRTDRDLRMLIPRILRSIPSKPTFEALRSLPWVEDEQLRLRCLAALGRVRDRANLPACPLAEVQARLSEEVRSSYALLASWMAAEPRYGTPLLVDDVELSLKRGRRRLLRILELRYPRAELALVLRHVESLDRGATALETLDALLEPPLKGIVLPLFENLTHQKMLEKAGALAQTPQEPLVFLLARCADPDPYSAFVALHAAGAARETGALEVAVKALLSPSALVREGAIHAVARLARPEDRRGLLEPLSADVAPSAALAARRRLEGLEEAMYSTVEKVLFLMSVPIFQKLPGEDLAPLAQAAEVESHHRGSFIVKEGDAGDSLYVVLRGQVAIQKSGQTLATLGPKDTFGEMAVLDAEARSADAVALEETEVLRIGSEEFWEVLREQTEIAEGVIKVLSRRLREADARIKERS